MTLFHLTPSSEAWTQIISQAEQMWNVCVLHIWHSGIISTPIFCCSYSHCQAERHLKRFWKKWQEYREQLFLWTDIVQTSNFLMWSHKTLLGGITGSAVTLYIDQMLNFDNNIIPKCAYRIIGRTKNHRPYWQVAEALHDMRKVLSGVSLIAQHWDMIWFCINH